MSRILLTGTRAPVALDLARALRRQGHEVFGCDVIKSTLFEGTMTYRPPRQDPKGFRSDVERIINLLAPDLIIPLCEEIYYWAHLRASALFAPDLDTLMRLHSKYDFALFAASLGLDVPLTERTGDWAPKSVFKPEFSRFGVRVLIQPATGPEVGDPNNPWIRQAYIDGEDLCFYAIARGGRIQAFTGYRPAWRIAGGASYYFDPVETGLKSRLLAISTSLAKALDLTGQIACDLRLDSQNKLWLLECNPRATSGLHLLAQNPAALTAAIVGEGDKTFGETQPACLGLAMKIYGWPEAFRNGRLEAWGKDMARARDVLQGKNISAFADAIQFSLKAAMRGQDLAAFLTHDIECNHRLTWY